MLYALFFATFIIFELRIHVTPLWMKNFQYQNHFNYIIFYYYTNFFHRLSTCLEEKYFLIYHQLTLVVEKFSGLFSYLSIF